MINDTIAAISSGMTESGIGIIRISGPDSFSIADRIFRNSKGAHADFSVSNRVRHGFIIKNVSRETLDEVLIINMKAPHTYTGEDTIEIDCHGGVLMMRRVLEAVIQAGARPADPGEFTKRAFLNGKIDLAQAEAVIDIINSKNDKAAAASIRQLRGSVSREISKIRGEMLYDCAFIESALDDPEHYCLDGYSLVLKDHALKWKKNIQVLAESYDNGKIIKEGINTVIIGKPNSGKSSLLNAMLGEERAIVTNIPGTTRDTISESININGLTINIKDTAGIRNTDDVVESIGVERALKTAREADLILCIIDTSRETDQNDKEILTSAADCKGKLITVFNKSDLEPKFLKEDVLKHLPDDKRDFIYISAKNEYGINKLYEMISDMFASGKLDHNDEIVITSLRHYKLLTEAKESVNEVISSVDAGLPEDFYTIDIMNAYRSLGEITGDNVGEDLINEIFSRFCMGK